ncbi:MAG: GNAT family N-acetyltransferase [Gemmatirosa sp.]
MTSSHSPAPTLEVVRTYLELSAPVDLRGGTFPDGPPRTRVVLRAPCAVTEYRGLYDAVGRAYRWRDRLAWSDARLADWLARPDVAVHVLEVRTDASDAWRPAGYAELARHPAGDVEIVYFGLVAEAQGRGWGRALLTHAVDAAWAMGATRVWLHTCTLDGPAALPNYLARGFRPVREERYHVPREDDATP